MKIERILISYLKKSISGRIRRRKDIIISSVLIILSFSFYFSCSCTNCGSDETIVIIPDSIIVKADSFVISKTGEEFFKQYFQIDLQKSMFQNPFFHIYYNFRMLNPDFIDENADFYMTPGGEVVDTMEVNGIPDCLKNPSECSFYIYENEAIEIAKNEGLPEGMKDWLVSFRWSHELQKYIWHIISTEREIGEGDFYKAAGKEIIIDPSNGNVLKFRRWNIE